MLVGKNRKGRPAFTMQAISHTVLPEESGCTVRHILKAVLHFSTHSVARLTRVEGGILVNGQHARTIDIVHTGDVVTARTLGLPIPQNPAHTGKLAAAGGMGG